MCKFLVTYFILAITGTAQAIALSTVLVGYTFVFITLATIYCIVMIYVIRALIHWREFSYVIY